jgi:hypothetical protein
VLTTLVAVEMVAVLVHYSSTPDFLQNYDKKDEANHELTS